MPILQSTRKMKGKSLNALAWNNLYQVLSCVGVSQQLCEHFFTSQISKTEIGLNRKRKTAIFGVWLHEKISEHTSHSVYRISIWVYSTCSHAHKYIDRISHRRNRIKHERKRFWHFKHGKIDCEHGKCIQYCKQERK